MSVTVTTAAGGPQVQLANGNARTILGDLLALPDPLGGEMTPQDFRGRCTLALAEPALSTSIERPSAPAGTPGTWVIDFAAMPGRDNDYLRDRIGALIAVADDAQRRSTTVVWH
jgi:hypothetical protein